jgi:hypothetical protein
MRQLHDFSSWRQPRKFYHREIGLRLLIYLDANLKSQTQTGALRQS